MPTKLEVYNETLRVIGDAQLATLTDDVEARYVLDDAWDRAVSHMLSLAPWRFCTIVQTLAGSAATVAGYAYEFSKPGGWVRTHSVYVISTAYPSRPCPIDCREEGQLLYANVSSLTMRYVDSVGADPTVWTDGFVKGFCAYLAFLVANRLTGSQSASDRAFSIFTSVVASAKPIEAIPEDPWWPHQISGQMLRSIEAVLELGEWKFAIKTTSITQSGTPSPSYGYAFPKPADWIRTVEVYRQLTPTPIPCTRDVDYRDEGGSFHAQFSPVIVRYISSTLGIDARLWSQGFDSAVLAHASLHAALADPKTPGAVLAARETAWQTEKKSARFQDDMRERPQVRQVGRLVRSRFGRGTYTEQGYPWSQ